MNDIKLNAIGKEVIKNKLFAKLNSIGEHAVRERLAQGIYIEDKISLIHEWLRQQEDKRLDKRLLREEDRDMEANKLAREANLIARKALIIAIIAAITAIIGIIIVIISNIYPLYD